MKKPKLKEIITQEKVKAVLDNLVADVILDDCNCETLEKLRQAIYIFGENDYEVSLYQEFYKEIGNNN